MKGWVYIITSKAFENLIKVGFSSKDPELRAIELNNTGNPYPYEVVYEVLVDEPKNIEQAVHNLLKNKGFHENKEWFNCSIEVAKDAIIYCATTGNKNTFEKAALRAKFLSVAESTTNKTFHSLQNKELLVITPQTRDDYLQQGAELIQDELDNQANFAIELQQEIELKNVDLLSSSIIANQNLNQNVKNRIKEYSENIARILFSTAHFIENEKFKTVDEAINAINLSKFDKNRLTNLIDAQKNLSLSYSTLSAVVDIFKIANKNVLEEITKTDSANSMEKRLNKTALYLKNAIIVYELTNFVVNYLSIFQLKGINDIKIVQQEVYRDIENSHKNDEELRMQVNKGSNEKLRDMMLLEIAQRNAMRKSIEAKWEGMLNQIEGQTKTVGEAKTFIDDLKIIRDNSKNRIDILNITATTVLVENSINMISELASNIQDWALPPLDEKTACELLGLEF